MRPYTSHKAVLAASACCSLQPVQPAEAAAAMLSCQADFRLHDPAYNAVQWQGRLGHLSNEMGTMSGCEALSGSPCIMSRWNVATSRDCLLKELLTRLQPGPAQRMLSRRALAGVWLMQS